MSIISTTEVSNKPKHDVVLRAAHDLWRVLKAIEDDSKHVQANHGVSGPQLCALWELKEGGALTVGQVARLMHVHPSTVSGIADRLEAKGMLRRVRDGKDHRVVHLEITPEGVDLVQRVPRPARVRLVGALAAMPDQRLRTFASATRALADSVSTEG